MKKKNVLLKGGKGAGLTTLMQVTGVSRGIDVQNVWLTNEELEKIKKKLNPTFERKYECNYQAKHRLLTPKGDVKKDILNKLEYEMIWGDGK